MNALSESNLVDAVIEWVGEYKKKHGFADGPVTSDTDLIGSGLLDSYGMIDLLLFVESCTGSEIDLTDVDPSEFSVVSGVCRIALRNRHDEQLHPASR